MEILEDDKHRLDREATRGEGEDRKGGQYGEGGRGALRGARRGGTGIVLSPLDSYVTGRLVSQSVPAREVMGRDPLTADPDDLLSGHRRPDQGRGLQRGDRSWTAATSRSAWSPAPSSSGPRRAGCCSWTTASRPRASPASRSPTSSRSSTTTTSARSRPASPSRPRSTRWAARRRWSSSASARPAASPGGRRPRCCWRRSSRTRSSSARPRPPIATTGSWTTSRSSCSSTPGRSGRRCSRRPRTSATSPRPTSSGATSRSTRCARARPCASPRSRPWGAASWRGGRSC